MPPLTKSLGKDTSIANKLKPYIEFLEENDVDVQRLFDYGLHGGVYATDVKMITHVQMLIQMDIAKSLRILSGRGPIRVEAPKEESQVESKVVVDTRVVEDVPSETKEPANPIVDDKPPTKEQIIINTLDAFGPLTSKELKERLPHIKPASMDVFLSKMKKSGSLKVEGGKYAKA